MKSNNNEVAVKNMVCDRCIKVVRKKLKEYNIEFSQVDLGIIYFDYLISVEEKETLKNILKREGLELLEGREAKIINQIKSLILESVHHKKEKPDCQNFSDFISSKIGMSYVKISAIFSATEKRTIENYVIAQKIERVKELLVYNEHTLSEISYELDYSSPQHLSRQFKQVTGLSPTEFKKIGKRNKLDTI